jgi:putative solute:sodium symporter small subunit
MVNQTQPRNPPQGGSMSNAGAAQQYWKTNIRYVITLLVIWFLVSYGFGIFLVEPLNAITIPGTGFKLGFWFAQQGSIYVFIVLIFVYVYLMNKLDKQYGVSED